MKETKVVFIPPNGEIVAQDFALHRIAAFLKTQSITTYLLHVLDNASEIPNYTDHTISLDSKDAIIPYLQNNDFDLIFHRTWMHRYCFAAELAEQFSNIIVYIKDWHNYPKKKYELIYTTIEDFEGIERLFKSGRTILTHYTNKQYKLWAKRYDVSKKQFVFFPEYCTKSNFYVREQVNYNHNEVKLVMAGSLTPTSSSELVDAKGFYKKIKSLTSQKINVDIVLLKKFYSRVMNLPEYKDYLYEHTFNNYFNIKLGKEMDPSILKDYDFAIFSDTFYNYEIKEYPELYKYAVISRLVLYLEAGLPLIVNQEMKSLSKLVKKHNLGFVFKDNDVKSFKKILDINTSEYQQLVKNIYSFREKYTYNHKTMKPLMDKLHEKKSISIGINK